VIDSKIPKSFHVDDGHVKPMYMTNFLDSGLGRGKLIYIDEAQRENLEKLALDKGLTVVSNTDDMDIIRAIGNRCLIVSEITICVV